MISNWIKSLNVYIVTNVDSCATFASISVAVWRLFLCYLSLLCHWIHYASFAYSTGGLLYDTFMHLPGLCVLMPVQPLCSNSAHCPNVTRCKAAWEMLTNSSRALFWGCAFNSSWKSFPLRTGGCVSHMKLKVPEVITSCFIVQSSLWRDFWHVLQNQGYGQGSDDMGCSSVTP